MATIKKNAGFHREAYNLAQTLDLEENSMRIPGTVCVAAIILGGIALTAEAQQKTSTTQNGVEQPGKPGEKKPQKTQPVPN
ncbi:MAG TPA: hypothetical protein VNW97_03050, partial [Candidatus Saccharimonadales bacterium]|nr:hypothetical protein [Candidatus Saccharimonadales bacterium]